MGVMLQTESKRTLAGWIWLIFTGLSTIGLIIFVDTAISSDKLLGYISLFFTITTFIVVAIITIRPEKWFNKLIIGEDDVPPFFKATEAPSIYDVAESSFIAKELDSFYGNCLVLIGFVVNIVFPLHKLVQIVTILDNYGILIVEGIKVSFLGFFIYLLRKEIIKDKKYLREHFEIVWRYNSFIAKQKLESHLEPKINALEDSIKIQNWSKAKYQINIVNKHYLEQLAHFTLNLPGFLHAFQFLLGLEGYRYSHRDFSFDQQKLIFSELEVLGLDYHIPEMARTLGNRITEYNVFNISFRDSYNQITNYIKDLKVIIESDETLVTKKDHFNNLFKAMDFWLFHIENKEYSSKQFGMLASIVSKSDSEELKDLFGGVKSITELFNKLIKKNNENYKLKIEVRLGKEALQEISTELTEIQKNLFIEIDNCKQKLKQT